MKLFNVYSRFSVNLVEAKGAYVIDDKGQKYLDLYGGHGVMSIGHSHPHYTQKLKAQIDKIGFYSNSIEMPLQEELADKLTQLSGYTDYKVFLCNSGAEANENAIKVASFHTQRKKVVAFNGGFHGRTATALNVTNNPKLSAPVNQHNFPVEFVDLNDKEQLTEALKKEDVCAVIIEGIQGVGGLDMPTDAYLQFLSEQCKKYGTMLILDEIQAGFGRSGKFFAHQHANIKADIISMAKGMGNGFPIGGVLIQPAIAAKAGMLGTTFGGNHLACVACIAVLDTLKNEHLIEGVADKSAFLRNELEQIPDVKKVKGRGLMMGVDLGFPIKELRKQILQEHHIFTGSSANPNVLRILPPLGITTNELASFVEALKKVL